MKPPYTVVFIISLIICTAVANNECDSPMPTFFMFVTSRRYSVAELGEDLGDRLCQAEAATSLIDYIRHRSSLFRTWMSDSSHSAFNVVYQGVFGFYWPSCEPALQVLPGMANPYMMPPSSYLDANSSSRDMWLPLDEVSFWTGTTSFGSSSGLNCLNWSPKSTGGHIATGGARTIRNPEMAWTDAGTTTCDNGMYLYCLQSAFYEGGGGMDGSSPTTSSPSVTTTTATATPAMESVSATSSTLASSSASTSSAAADAMSTTTATYRPTTSIVADISTSTSVQVIVTSTTDFENVSSSDPLSTSGPSGLVIAVIVLVGVMLVTAVLAVLLIVRGRQRRSGRRVTATSAVDVRTSRSAASPHRNGASSRSQSRRALHARTSHFKSRRASVDPNNAQGLHTQLQAMRSTPYANVNDLRSAGGVESGVSGHGPYDAVAMNAASVSTTNAYEATSTPLGVPISAYDRVETFGGEHSQHEMHYDSPSTPLE